MIQEQLSTLFLEQSKDSIWMIDIDYKLIYANRTYLRIMQTITGKKQKLNESVLLQGDIETWKENYNKAFEGVYFGINDHYYDAELKEIQYGQTTFEPLRNEEDMIYAVVCQWKNVSHILKHTNEAKQLMDSTLDVFCTFDEEGKFVYVNEAAKEHWGYEPEELLGTYYRSLVIEEDLTITDSIDKDIKSGQKIKSFSNRYRKKDGGIAYNLWSSRWDECTKLFYSVARDGKDKIEQEEKLLQSEQRFKALVTGAFELVGVLDTNGHYLYMSPSIIGIAGIPPEEFIGKNAFEFVHPDDIKQTLSDLEKVIKEDRVTAKPYRAKNHKNEWRWVESVLTNMLDNPAINGIVVNSRDITDKIEQEEKIQHSEQRFKALVQEGSDLIGILDADGIYQYVSFTSESILGLSPEYFIGKSAFDLIHPEDSERVRAEMQNITSNSVINLKPFRFQNHEKEWRWIETVLTNMLDNPAVMGIVANSRDITEDKKLRELSRQAYQISKIGNWEVDLLNKNIYWSEEIHKLHETDSASFRPDLKKAINFYREDFQEEVASKIEKCISTGEPFDFEAVILTTSKKEVWVRVIGNAEFIGGKCDRIYGSTQNINERKEAEIRLNSLADNLPGVVYQYIIHPDGTDDLKYVSKGSQKVWGFSSQEVLQNNQLVWESIQAGGDYEKVNDSIADSIAGKTNWTARWKYIMPNGEPRTHLGNGTPIFLTNGTIVLNAVILDITQETKNEELLEQTSELARIGSWEMDLINQKGDNMYWSPMLFEIVELDDNYNPTLTGGIEFHIGESKERIQKALELLIKEGVEFDEEILLLSSKGNERWCRAIGKSEIVNDKRTKIYGSYQDIHKRKVAELDLLKAKEKAEASDAKFKAYTEQSPIAIYTTNMDGDCVYANETWLDMAGMHIEEALGKGWINALHPDDLEHVTSNWYKSIRLNGKWSYEYRFINKSGKITWLNGSAKELLNEKNELVGYLGTNINITEKKKAEEDKFSLQKTLENSLNEIYIFDAENLQFNYVNKGALLNLGYTENEIKALTPLDLKPGFTETSFREIVAPLLNSEKKKIIFFTNHKRKDGSLYPVEVHLQLVTEGNTKRFIAIILDITERKKSEEEERFKANLLSTIGQAAIATNLDGIVTYWNKAAENIYGWKQKEAVGNNIIDLTPTDTNKQEAIQIMESLKKGKTWSGEFQVKKKDGTIFPVLISNSPIYDENKVISGIIGLSSDITQKVKYEKLLMQHTEELERSNTALKKIAWTQSHVVRAPIARILAVINLLEEQPNSFEEISFWIKQLKNSTFEMDEIVKNIINETNN